MKLSIIIPWYNDPELPNTLKSIWDTSGDKCEVIVVDDCNPKPVEVVVTWDIRNQLRGMKIVHNRIRCGCGPSRHIGALHATGDVLLLIDPHMRFVPGWYEEAVRRIEARPKTLHCATCVALDHRNMNPMASKSWYQGATVCLFGPDKNAPGKNSVMECVWNPAVPELDDDAELAAVMGACYFIPREWFLKLGALRFLRIWGGDEMQLSLKCWLSGGDIRYMKNVRIGHRFTMKDEPKRFVAPKGFPTWNKIFSIRTLLPERLHKPMMDLLRQNTAQDEWNEADRMKIADWHLIAQEQAYNKHIFECWQRRSWEWYSDKFGVKMP